MAGLGSGRKAWVNGWVQDRAGPWGPVPGGLTTVGVVASCGLWGVPSRRDCAGPASGPVNRGMWGLVERPGPGCGGFEAGDRWCGLAVVRGGSGLYFGGRDCMWSLLKEFWAFARRERKWWLVPLVLILLAVGAVLVFTSSGGIVWALYPFM